MFNDQQKEVPGTGTTPLTEQVLLAIKGGNGGAAPPPPPPVTGQEDIIIQ